MARVVGGHLMSDKSVAFAMARKDPAQARAAYRACGVSSFFCWHTGVGVGALVGAARALAATPFPPPGVPVLGGLFAFRTRKEQPCPSSQS